MHEVKIFDQIFFICLGKTFAMLIVEFFSVIETVSFFGLCQISVLKLSSFKQFLNNFFDTLMNQTIPLHLYLLW